MKWLRLFLEEIMQNTAQRDEKIWKRDFKTGKIK